MKSCGTESIEPLRQFLQRVIGGRHLRVLDLREGVDRASPAACAACSSVQPRALRSVRTTFGQVHRLRRALPGITWRARRRKRLGSSFIARQHRPLSARRCNARRSLLCEARPLGNRPSSMDAPCPDPFNPRRLRAVGRPATSPGKIALAVLGAARAERWSYARLEGGRPRAWPVRSNPRASVRATGFSCGWATRSIFPVAFLGAVAAGLVPVPTAAGLTVPEINAPGASRDALRHPRTARYRAGPKVAACPVFTDIGAMMAHAPGETVFGPPDRLAYLVFTSGSSGDPKAVAHAHRAVWGPAHDVRWLVRAWP